MATPLNFSELERAKGLRFQTWQQIKNILSRLDPSEPRANLAANALAACYAKKQLAQPEDADEAFRAWNEADAFFLGVPS